jgi:hypothetical protein
MRQFEQSFLTRERQLICQTVKYSIDVKATPSKIVLAPSYET